MQILKLPRIPNCIYYGDRKRARATISKPSSYLSTLSPSCTEHWIIFVLCEICKKNKVIGPAKENPKIPSFPVDLVAHFADYYHIISDANFFCTTRTHLCMSAFYNGPRWWSIFMWKKRCVIINLNVIFSRKMLGFQVHGPYLGVWQEDPDGLWFESWGSGSLPASDYRLRGWG